MPELPEVELHRRHLERWLSGRTVDTLALRPAGLTRGTTAAGVRKLLLGARLGQPQRRGKHLWIPTRDGEALYVHLGMTGHWSRRALADPPPRFVVLSLTVGRHVVDLTDSRRFSTLGVVKDPSDDKTPWAGLGPDLLLAPPTPAQLCAALQTRKPLKVALLEQDRVAGLGNIHAAEALWRARLDPTLEARRLTTIQARALLRGVAQAFELVLGDDDGEGVAYVEIAGNPNPFRIYGRRGEPCPRCKKPIDAFPQAGRTTYVCWNCQRQK